MMCTIESAQRKKAGLAGQRMVNQQECWFSYGVKAIQVRIYAKDAIDKPVQDAKASLTEGNMGDVIYQTHVSDIGWQKKVADGAEAGTTGQSKAVEALNIKLSDEWEARDASVLYEAHVANIGWQDEVMDGAMAGTTGQGKAMEAIRIKVLNGDSPDGIRIDDVYDIYYRDAYLGLWLACMDV